MPTLRKPLIPATLALVLSVLAGAALAEKADRNKPSTLESDQPCKVDLVKQISVCTGNVVISQGSLLIRAEKIEIRETPEGYRLAQAVGTAAKPASYRQKRDTGDEVVEGQAQRIDFDGKAGTTRFEGQAVARRMLGTRVVDELQGALIIWDSVAESFTLQGGAPNAGNPTGRVRAVSTPRLLDEPAAASTPLKPTGTLGERR
jgi:lipopolysaccharide export system protein LptA